MVSIFRWVDLAKPALLELLEPVTQREDEQVAAEPRRIAMAQPPPFVAQLLEDERVKAIDLALDRCFIPAMSRRPAGLRSSALRSGRLSVRHTIKAVVRGLFRSERQP